VEPAIGLVLAIVNVVDQCAKWYSSKFYIPKQATKPMSSFRDITKAFAASPQISLQDVETAANEGFVAIICNRPDGEDGGQLSAAQIGAACTALGLGFTHIPVVGQMSQSQVAAMASALDQAEGAVLAYCRSGTRSTNLWALAQASNGAAPEDLIAEAATGGYDLSGLAPTLRAMGSR
jgi:uncharacterized protein (TIGR01244 family)